MSDVFIGYDGGQFFRTYLYSYNGSLYCLIPDQDNFSTPTAIRMYMSTNGGATWTALSSTLSAQESFNVSGPPVLIGTKLYIYYAVNATSANGLAYFDFTTNTFTSVTTTGNLSYFSLPCMAGAVATQLYIADAEHGLNGIQISQYSSNAFSAIGQLNPAGSYVYYQLQILILGSSGVLHVFYAAAATETSSGDLGYANVVSGSLSAGTIIYTGFLDQEAAFGGNSTGPAIQIGSNIYFSFYDAINKQVKMVAFNDSASPTFTVSVIDPSFTITKASFFPTGYWTNLLASYGSTLYCFYVNTNYQQVSGDGNLYYRTSTNNGSTWSARQTLTQHLDPIQGTPFAIWLPEAVQYVGTPGTVPKVSYLQALADSSSLYGQGRFFFGVASESARNYVLS